MFTNPTDNVSKLCYIKLNFLRIEIRNVMLEYKISLFAPHWEEGKAFT